MKIGLTYDLRSEYLAQGFSEEETAEFDRDETVISIEKAVQACGHETERIGNFRGLMEKLSAGRRWDMVFNICEGMYGLGREALVPALLDAYRIPYTFSDPVVLAVSLHKAMTKRIVRDCGVPTPDFALVESVKDIRSVKLPLPLFAKPLGEGTGKGIDSSSKINDTKELKEVCEKLLSKYRQPVLVENYLPGREFTVGIVGTREDAEVVGVMEVILRDNAESHAYSYVNKEKFEELVGYRLMDGPVFEECEKVGLQAWRGLGCRDAGRIDVRMDGAGKVNFMEVNPLAGLHPEHSDLPIICTKAGVPYQELIARILKSAAKRIAGS